MKLFIDADSIMFKAACTQETKHDTRVVTRKIIEDTIADCFADETYIAIKGKGNFRYDIYSDYKSSRKDTELDKKLRERLNDAASYLIKDWGAITSNGMEADDVVCIWAHEAREADEQFVIAHIYKDINQITNHVKLLLPAITIKSLPYVNYSIHTIIICSFSKSFLCCLNTITLLYFRYIITIITYK